MHVDSNLAGQRTSAKIQFPKVKIANTVFHTPTLSQGDLAAAQRYEDPGLSFMPLAG